MLALSEPAFLGLIGAAVSVLVALITLFGVVYQAHKTRGELNTENGSTIGQAIGRMHDMLWHHEQRLDAIEVQVREGRREVRGSAAEVTAIHDQLTEQSDTEESNA